jgi:DNA-binding PadR family transcriptional regulator
MPSKTKQPTEESPPLLPLTPAVFFILFALAGEEKHGYAIMQEVSRLSDGKFRMGPGTLYTTIQRLLELSLIEESDTESGGRRRYYRLTRNGRIALKAELGRMEALVRRAARQKLVPQGGG